MDWLEQFFSWEWIDHISNAIQLAAMFIFGGAVAIRLVWAWFVEAPRMKRRINAAETVNDKQQKQIAELNRKIQEALSMPGVKKVIVKRSKK